MRRCDPRLSNAFLTTAATQEYRGLAQASNLAFANAARNAVLAYDRRGRLTGETVSGSQTAVFNWAPDAVGNWLSTNQNGAAETRVANRDNEYTSVTGTTIAHDAEGNVTAYNGQTFTYDWANRLVTVTGPGLSASYTYDALNRRATETVNGVTTEFLYDGNRLIAEYAAGPAAAPQCLYVWNPADGAALLCRAGAATWLRLLTDRLGSVVGATDSAGNLIEIRLYSAYGRQTVTDPAGQPAEPIAGRLGYTGRPHDDATGLIDFHHRAYAPALGRFLQRDPAGFADGPNRYAYCQNDPVNRTDPDGRRSLNPAMMTTFGSNYGEYERCIMIGRNSYASQGNSGYGGYSDNGVRGPDVLTSLGLQDYNNSLLGQARNSAAAGTFLATANVGFSAVTVPVTGRTFSDLGHADTDWGDVARDTAINLALTFAIPEARLAAGESSLARASLNYADDVARAAVRTETAATRYIAAESRIVNVNPADLRWSQTTAGGGGRAVELRASLAENGWNGGCIDVVQTADGLATVDHTRAAVALELGIPTVPARVHLPEEPLPADMLNRTWNRAGDTATTWGEALRLRGAGQNPPIGPTGSPIPPRLPGGG